MLLSNSIFYYYNVEDGRYWFFLIISCKRVVSSNTLKVTQQRVQVMYLMKVVHKVSDPGLHLLHHELQW